MSSHRNIDRESTKKLSVGQYSVRLINAKPKFKTFGLIRNMERYYLFMMAFKDLSKAVAGFLFLEYHIL